MLNSYLNCTICIHLRSGIATMQYTLFSLLGARVQFGHLLEEGEQYPLSGIILLDSPLQAGIVFQFDAIFVAHGTPFSFQIWRPMSQQRKLFQLVSTKTFTPLHANEESQVSYTKDCF